MKECAYCGASGKFTKEHLFPKWIIKRQPENTARFAMHEKRISERVQTVRDVCSSCNNVLLSRLDSYALDLYDQYFHRSLTDKGGVNFKYDYDRLARWLLKTLYNSARINKTRPDELEPFRDYILGKVSTPTNFRIFGFLVMPYKLSASERKSLPPENKGITQLLPRNISVTQFSVQVSEDSSVLLGRALLINSYALIVSILPAAIPRNFRRKAMQEIGDSFKSRFKGIQVLDPRFKSTHLKASSETIVSLKRDSRSLFAGAYRDYFERRQRKQRELTIRS